MSRIIDGKAVAETVRAEVAARVTEFRARHGRAPGLTVVLVGDDPASGVYVRNKENAANQVGMIGHVHRLPEATSSEQLLALVRQLNADAAVDGILVQLPLPKHVDADAVLAAIDPDKDVDGLHARNVGQLWLGKRSLVPC